MDIKECIEILKNPQTHYRSWREKEDARIFAITVLERLDGKRIKNIIDNWKTCSQLADEDGQGEYCTVCDICDKGRDRLASALLTELTKEDMPGFEGTYAALNKITELTKE